MSQLLSPFKRVRRRPVCGSGRGWLKLIDGLPVRG